MTALQRLLARDFPALPAVDNFAPTLVVATPFSCGRWFGVSSLAAWCRCSARFILRIFRLATTVPTIAGFAGVSGQWTGFTNQGSPANKRRLDLLLQVRDQQLSGVGDDDQGMFVISGEFDVAAQEFRWVQTYLFGSTLFCRGFCDEHRIWGTWQDAAQGHGGFQIWPLVPASNSQDVVGRG